MLPCVFVPVAVGPVGGAGGPRPIAGRAGGCMGNLALPTSHRRAALPLFAAVFAGGGLAGVEKKKRLRKAESTVVYAVPTAEVAADERMNFLREQQENVRLLMEKKRQAKLKRAQTSASKWKASENTLPAHGRPEPAAPWKLVSHPSAPGQWYYYNTQTGETSWDDPTGAPAAESTITKQTWQRVEHPSSPGKFYYHNTATGETTWDVPVDYRDEELTPGAQGDNGKESDPQADDGNKEAVDESGMIQTSVSEKIDADDEGAKKANAEGELAGTEDKVKEENYSEEADDGNEEAVDASGMTQTSVSEEVHAGDEEEGGKTANAVGEFAGTEDKKKEEKADDGNEEAVDASGMIQTSVSEKIDADDEGAKKANAQGELAGTEDKVKEEKYSEADDGNEEAVDASGMTQTSVSEEVHAGDDEEGGKTANAVGEFAGTEDKKKEEKDVDPEERLQSLKDMATQRRALMRARRRVLNGKQDKTAGGLTADKLRKNKRGAVVSIARSELSRARYAKTLGLWIESFKKAREALGVKGFVPLGGKTEAGQELHKKAKSIYEALKKDKEQTSE